MLKIFITDTKNRRVLFEVEPNETIKNLKMKVKAKMGINNNNDIDLLYNGLILDDDNTISDYEVQNLNVLQYLGLFKGGIYL